jgi:hypothetical protein
MRLLRGIGGETLPCGCLVGTYETYDGRIVVIIDGRSPACSDPDHRLHAIVRTAPATEPAFRHTKIS